MKFIEFYLASYQWLKVGSCFNITVFWFASSDLFHHYIASGIYESRILLAIFACSTEQVRNGNDE